MSKLIETITIPAVEARPERAEDRETGVGCDLCKRQARGSIDYMGTFQWGDPTDTAEVTVSLKTGASWPEGGSGEILRFDLCPGCFKKELVSWFETRGVAPQTTEWDY